MTILVLIYQQVKSVRWLQLSKGKARGRKDEAER